MTVSPTACDAGPGLLGDVRDPRVDARAGAAVAGAGSAAIEHNYLKPRGPQLPTARTR